MLMHVQAHAENERLHAQAHHTQVQVDTLAEGYRLMAAHTHFHAQAQGDARAQAQTQAYAQVQVQTHVHVHV